MHLRFLSKVQIALFLITAFIICFSDTLASKSYENIDSEPRIPFPAHSQYDPETLQPNHISQERQDELLRTTYDNWKKRYLIPIDNHQKETVLYRVSAGKRKSKKSFSEGQGYGMMLTVYMAGHDPQAQELFDGLWLFSRSHPSRIDPRFMAYMVPTSKKRQDSAFDGDCDIAFALLLADTQWGSNGIINYRREALAVIEALMEKVIGHESQLPMLGDWVRQNGRGYNQYTTRSSDIMPTHFKLFYQATGNPQWQKVTQKSQNVIEYMQNQFSPQSGLIPDFIVSSTGKETSYKPAPARYLESAYDGEYYYNASRVPWRVGADALLNNDLVSRRQIQRIARWALQKSNGKPSSIRPGYKLNGKRINNEEYLSKAFIAPLGVASMTIADGQYFINEVFDLCIELQQDYYEDTIGIFCLLLLTGNCWLPT